MQCMCATGNILVFLFDRNPFQKEVILWLTIVIHSYIYSVLISTDYNAHKIPRGDWFELVSCPHYLCEILIYVSLLVILGGYHLLAYAMVAFVLTNQVGCGMTSHQWYQTKFEDYPKSRKAIIPWILWLFFFSHICYESMQLSEMIMKMYGKLYPTMRIDMRSYCASKCTPMFQPCLFVVTIFWLIDNSAHVSVMPYIRCAVTSHPFSKWDQVEFCGIKQSLKITFYILRVERLCDKTFYFLKSIFNQYSCLKWLVKCIGNYNINSSIFTHRLCNVDHQLSRLYLHCFHHFFSLEGIA